MSKLTEAIEELVNEKTFSLEALDAIKRLKDLAKQLEESIKVEEANSKGLAIRLREANEKISVLEVLNKEYESVNRILNSRIDEVAKLEIVTEYAEKRRQDAIDLVRLVFKSPVYKKEISSYGNAPVANQTGGYTTGSTSENKTEKTIEE